MWFHSDFNFSPPSEPMPSHHLPLQCAHSGLALQHSDTTICPAERKDRGTQHSYPASPPPPLSSAWGSLSSFDRGHLGWNGLPHKPFLRDDVATAVDDLEKWYCESSLNATSVIYRYRRTHAYRHRHTHTDTHTQPHREWEGSANNDLLIMKGYSFWGPFLLNLFSVA